MPRNPNAVRPATCSGPDCDVPLVQSQIGRPRLYCSARCTDRAVYAEKRSSDIPRTERWRGLDLTGIVDDAFRERFWSKVDTSGECWTWTRHCNNHGYGQFTFRRGDFRLAHVVSYALEKEPVPPGLVVCHRCDNPPCVRPDHLFLGTQRDNALDMFDKGRQGSRHPGTERANAILTDADVLEIRATQPYYGRVAHLARHYGVSAHTVKQVLDGTAWGHIA